ncbi:MAG: permease-like cell division protein FtsX [Bacteroidales bacterium]|nr:permease-like cell division protein FtsX [Bacteroidales bacterium]
MTAQKREKNNIRARLVRSYISSIISIAMVLFVVGLFALVLFWAQGATRYFKENMRLSIILQEQVTASAAEQFTKNVEVLPQVKSARLISKEEGAVEMREFLGEDFLEIFSTNPLPATIEVQMHQEYLATDSLRSFKEHLMEGDMVEDVVYQESLISLFNSNIKKGALIILGIGALLAFIAIVLINNTVRLNIYSKRFSIHAMQLVGATKGFIRKPFLYRAVIQGILSALLAIAALCGVLYFLYSRHIDIVGSFVTIESIALVMGALVVLGVLLCFFCTYMVVKKMADMSVEKLYY